MKFKNIMLMTLLLLAILTIGAVSATEDADTLAVDDLEDEQIAESPVDVVVGETVDNEVAEASVDDDVVEAEENDNVLTSPSASFGNEIYSDYHSVVSVFDYSKGLNGTVTLFANNTQVYNKEVAGDYVTIYAKDIIGSFYGVYNMKVIYNGTDGTNFEKEGTVNFTKSFINKVFVPEDFNVTFPASKIDIGQGNPVVLTYFWPEGVKEHISFIKVKYGEGEYDYRTFETQWDPEKDPVNVYKNITWEEFYLSDVGVFNISVYYCEDDNVVFELGKINLTVVENKVYTANDFMEVYSKTITSPTDYVCIVHDENGLNGVLTIYHKYARIPRLLLSRG